MDLSLVIPLLNEEASLHELSDWITRVCKSHGLDYEIVFVDDGSTDNSWKIIEEIAKNNSSVKAVKFRRNYGKAAGLDAGFREAEGEIVITMDADLQDNPDEIPELYKMIKDNGYDLVSCWKKKRHDPIGKTLPSKFFNWTTRKLSGIKIHDFNCGLKAYRKDLIKSLRLQGEMHRYIPVLAKSLGYEKITEKVVKHQERKYGVSKYGIERILKGYLDLLTVSFISKFGKRPMHLFGTLGTLLFLLGFVIAAYLSFEKFFYQAYRMTDRPLFYLGLLSMLMGLQLFLTGFLAEMISRSGNREDVYQIEKRL
jgi:glycosyltransferase involved in cell wall biosynthesis